MRICFYTFWIRSIYPTIYIESDVFDIELLNNKLYFLWCSAHSFDIETRRNFSCSLLQHASTYTLYITKKISLDSIAVCEKYRRNSGKFDFALFFFPKHNINSRAMDKSRSDSVVNSAVSNQQPNINGVIEYAVSGSPL